jgi:lipid-A-disaccharide synthase
VPDVLIVAGETSGDLHAASMAAQLRQELPGHRLLGIGSSRMEAAGVVLLERSENLAALGLVEVARHVPAHLRLFRMLRNRIADGSICLVVLIDYPGFNMKVARAATSSSIPVLYYITPQVWAWGAGRLRKIARVVTRAAVILPFEEQLLRSHGIDAVFVGHPLLDHAEGAPQRDAARRSLGFTADERVLALFPGSRTQEIARHLDAFVETARILTERDPELRVIVSGAPDVWIDPQRCPYPVVSGDSFAILRAADAALCKSGTTTLEAAVAGCPHVIAYRTNPITYAVAKRVVKISHIGLVNIVAERQVVPEFVQGAMVPVQMADALTELMRLGSPERRAMVAGLEEVRNRLGEPGAGRRVAAMARDMVLARTSPRAGG